jgi:tRNA uridine 5-carboxymethylaminomethyl modification enzyme
VPIRLSAPWAQSLEVRVRYRGYIERQKRTAGQAAAMERHLLPAALWEDELRGVSFEALEKLRRSRPLTVGQASRIAGVSPADVAVLILHSRRLSARPEPAGER